MVKHNYEVYKTVLAPYYKYKQDAYKKLKGIIDLGELKCDTEQIRAFNV